MDNPILKRVSIRSFSEKSVEEEKVLNILKAAMAAPSAGNQQPWKFIVIRNKEVLEKLATVSPYATPVKKATVSILVLGSKENIKYPQHVEHDLSAVTENILLQAVIEGLGGVWIALCPEVDRMEKAREILNLDANLFPFTIIPIGYSDKELTKKSSFDIDRVTFIN